MASPDQHTKFSYESYRFLLDVIAEKGYEFCGYGDWRKTERPVILRHDVDYSLTRALPIAELEASQGVRSTFFILVRGDFYNVLSREGEHVLCKLVDLGHEIGLHFDETLYAQEEQIQGILQESKILEHITGARVKSVSMHRPSRRVLEGNWDVPGMENTYAREYLEDFKYISDSRMRWREDAVTVIRSGSYPKLQILTHPFWYRERSLCLPGMLEEFIESAQSERVMALDANFTHLGEEIGDDVVRAAKVLALIQGQVFETERLVLRPLKRADAADMFEYTSNAEVCRFLNWGPYGCLDEANAWLDAKLSRINPSDILLGIEEMSSCKLIGVVRVFNIDSPLGSAEISYILNPKFSGKGYITEACRKILSICFKDLGISTVYACVDIENIASEHVVKRLGMNEVAGHSFTVEIKGSARPHRKFAIYRRGDA